MNTTPTTFEHAEIIAIQALGFLADEPERLGRFLSLTGIAPDELRSRAGTPALLAGVLDHLLRDESTLLVFCSLHSVAPEDIAPAHRALTDRVPNTTPDDTPNPAA